MPNAFSAASKARRHCGAVADIRLDRERLAAGLLDALRTAGEPIEPPGHQNDRGAVFRQNLGKAHA